jgi:hypothetical protein
MAAYIRILITLSANLTKIIVSLYLYQSLLRESELN